ncbi:MAG: hypothetical protein D6785_09135, partial [Planctomycetota bacterium]
MCGILGIVKQGEGENLNVFKSMLETLNHRGPDDQGIFSHENLILGHTRLSIIDLEQGRQPFYYEFKGKIIRENGSQDRVIVKIKNARGAYLYGDVILTFKKLQKTNFRP